VTDQARLACNADSKRLARLPRRRVVEDETVPWPPPTHIVPILLHAAGSWRCRGGTIRNRQTVDSTRLLDH
jgi:hypothetical protein